VCSDVPVGRERSVVGVTGRVIDVDVHQWCRNRVWGRYRERWEREVAPDRGKRNVGRSRAVKGETTSNRHWCMVRKPQSHGGQV
jgi:hypothetical protein